MASAGHTVCEVPFKKGNAILSRAPNKFISNVERDLSSTALRYFSSVREMAWKCDQVFRLKIRPIRVQMAKEMPNLLKQRLALLILPKREV